MTGTDKYRVEHGRQTGVDTVAWGDLWGPDGPETYETEAEARRAIAEFIKSKEHEPDPPGPGSFRIVGPDGRLLPVEINEGA